MTTPRRILVALWDGGGTVPPELAIVGGLVARGHDVTVIGDAVLAGEVTATGAHHVPWATAPQHVTRRPEDDFIRDWEAKNPLQLFARVRDRFLCGPARLFANDVAAELQRRPADVLVASQSCSVPRWAPKAPAFRSCPSTRTSTVCPAAASRRRAPVGRRREGDWGVAETACSDT